MDELISKQELLNSFGLSEKTRKWGGDHSGYNTMMLYEIQDMIESQPPVNSQKTGQWIFEGNQCFSCSSCGRIYTQKAFEYLKLHKDDSDFPNNCPNCGARMD